MRLIDADAVRKKAVPHTRGEHGYNANIRKWAVLVGDIDDAPTVDAVHRETLAQVMWERDVAMGQLEEHGIPFGCKADVRAVVHGEWVHDINNLYGCSECMERETMSHKKLKNYCPNCGAKMDRENKENENA